MKLLWEENAWDEYCAWQIEDKKTLKRINALLKDIQRESYDGIGKPEPLSYLNGHCFVSIMLCVPVWKHGKCAYISVPLGYRMWQKDTSKLNLAADMVRSRKGIEMLINLINISYCAMKILPYREKVFSEYQDKSVQEFRFVLSSQIRKQIFYAHFVKTIESGIKSKQLINDLKVLIQQQGYYFLKL